VVAKGGEPLRLLGAEIDAAVERAGSAGVEAGWGESLQRRFQTVAAVTAELGARGMAGDVDAMLLHSADYLAMFSILTVAWQHLLLATAAQGKDTPFHQGLLRSAQYWMHTELPRVDHLAELCRTAEDSYAGMKPEWF